jgi:integrase
MRTTFSMISLFELFIKDSYKGKRLQRNGQKIKIQTVKNYHFVLKALKNFQDHSKKELLIKPLRNLSKYQLNIQFNYWRKFYREFSNYLYKKGCFDNYSGFMFKTLKTFFGYLNKEKLIITGDFYKRFYVKKEEIPVLTLTPEQLHFLIADKTFESSLPFHLQRTKDLFVFGCTIAMRYSDLFSLKVRDVEQRSGFGYLSVQTKKTDTRVRVKIPSYGMEIVAKYANLKKGSAALFRSISKNQFNRNLKNLLDRAGFNFETGKVRTVDGNQKELLNISNKAYRFSELASSHLMRRTAVTTMLLLGMPEFAVKKISGHSPNSRAFYRYVNYAQSYLDREIDKVHLWLVNQPAEVTNSLSD